MVLLRDFDLPSDLLSSNDVLLASAGDLPLDESEEEGEIASSTLVGTFAVMKSALWSS
jgi:hypothetical protein